MNNNSVWLHSDISTAEALQKQLDKIDTMDFADFVLPANWEQQKKRMFEETGEKPPTFRHVRGTVTLASSIIGTENFIVMFMDEPELIQKLSETIKNVIFKYIDLFDKEAGFAPGKGPASFSFADDDCALMTPDMYEMFGYPILKAVFEKVAPKPEDGRYQHSDSAMGHLLPILSRLNLTGCNFGPTLTVSEIRAAMPHTRIDG